MKLTEKQYKELFSKSLDYKINKYHNKSVEIDGIKFDSKKEMLRYKELKLMQKARLISELELQKKFELQPAFKDNNGKTQRKITYVCDFYYYSNKEKKYIVEDVKSIATKTQVYKIKKKLFLYKYPEIKFIEYI